MRTQKTGQAETTPKTTKTHPSIDLYEPINIAGDDKPADMPDLVYVGIVLHSYISQHGFVPRKVLERDVPAEILSPILSVLHKRHRVIVESTKPMEGGKQVKGFEPGEKRFSREDLLKLPWLAAAESPKQRYAGYIRVERRLRYTTPPAAGRPSEDEAYLVFDRDFKGHCIVASQVHLRHVLETGLRLIGKAPSIAGWVYFEDLIVPDETVRSTPQTHVAVIGERGQGLGTKFFETTPPGTEVTLTAYIPTTELSESDYDRALALAGRFNGASAARYSESGKFVIVGGAG